MEFDRPASWEASGTMAQEVLGHDHEGPGRIPRTVALVLYPLSLVNILGMAHWAELRRDGMGLLGSL